MVKMGISSLGRLEISITVSIKELFVLLIIRNVLHSVDSYFLKLGV